MTALFIAQIGDFDFADYVRVGPQDGLDPYGSGWQTPQFADAAFGDGQPLSNVSVGNREMVWPLYLNRNFLLPGDNLTPEEELLMAQHIHELVVDMNRALAEPNLQLQWCDSHAPAITYYDVAFARFDPDYDHRQDQYGWKAGTLRVWCSPPWGHTGTHRIVGTSAGGSGMVQVISTPTLAGDVPALTRAKITAPAVGTLGNPGRVVGFAALPNATYPARWPAASMTVTANATVTTAGASDMQDGQFVYVTSAQSRAKFGVTLTPASQFHGSRHRVFAVARPRQPVGLAITAQLEGVPLGATGLATNPFGLSVVDLGAFETAADDPRGSLRLDIEAQRPYDSALLPPWDFRYGLTNTSGVYPGVNQILVVPEDRLTLLVDNTDTLVGEDDMANTLAWGGVGTVTLDGEYDDYGNQWHLATLANASYSLKEVNDGAGKGFGAIATQNRAGAVLGHRPIRDMRVLTYTNPGWVDAATHTLAGVCKTFDGDVTPAASGARIEGQMWMGATPWIALLSYRGGATTLHASRAVAINSPTIGQNVRVELACKGADISFALVEMAATNPVMASIGASLGALDYPGRAALVGNYDQRFVHVQVAESPRLPVADGDAYWLGDRTYMEASGAASVVRLMSDQVGAQPAIPIDGAAIAFCAPMDANNALATTAVEIRAQERFTLAR